ncbi:MAG TPA: GNAT family N-acetyltransferase [Rickettsiales bacterium]|nr:GNAT family N-acetyltransferase [Rickettsiales bacterium]
MIIRKILVSDALEFIKFFKKILSETDYLLPVSFDITEEEEKEVIGKFNDNKNVFLALDESDIVGFVGVTKNQTQKRQHVADFTIAVLQSHQKKGIASMLLSEAEKFLKGLGVIKLEISVVEENEKARKFYYKHKFLEEGVKHKSMNINGKLHNEICLYKLL